MPGFPHLFIPVVDVRDVAAAHILAMTTDGAAGQRFLLSSGPAIALKGIGATLKANLGDAAKRVPTRSIPNIVVRVAALFSAEFRSLAGMRSHHRDGQHRDQLHRTTFGVHEVSRSALRDGLALAERIHSLRPGPR